LFAVLVLMGVVRPALKSLMQAPTGGAAGLANQRGGQLEAIESEQPDRPQLNAPRLSNETAQPSASELRLEDARKLTRDNPAAVANIVKTWINGEAPA
jgi:flagellar M-ring protein FliF